MNWSKKHNASVKYLLVVLLLLTGSVAGHVLPFYQTSARAACSQQTPLAEQGQEDDDAPPASQQLEISAISHFTTPNLLQLTGPATALPVRVLYCFVPIKQFFATELKTFPSLLGFLQNILLFFTAPHAP